VNRMAIAINAAAGRWRAGSMARAILTAPMLVLATMDGLATIGSGGRSSVIEVLDPLFIFTAPKGVDAEMSDFRKNLLEMGQIV
jgi:hypothetical protein